MKSILLPLEKETDEKDFLEIDITLEGEKLPSKQVEKMSGRDRLWWRVLSSVFILIGIGVVGGLIYFLVLCGK